MLRYPVTLTPDDDGTLLVTCPDLPEVTSFGEGSADALVHGADAVATALKGRITARQPVPPPGPINGHAVALSALTALKLELYRAMLETGIRKADLVGRLRVHPPQVDRLLDLDHESRLSQIEAALTACGREIVVATQAA
ncbi:type II toxin-antitoxin system HicB family antitoxin [Methylobacterium sp. WL18]|uniref:type II toxin-antitoxin system HicB family antitoxin n=1 Tax=Methylobacterium sp. WL18 TaxID=2603897 RepID=UPI0011CCD810|nr:type II toxin-antitoxin system HicB family antitoxin [Methylobacterium sp. WL18]TXN51722.1 type II toxin-antitoxin system HicB family antitoxin [Methylobacterium sp. WL18]